MTRRAFGLLTGLPVWAQLQKAPQPAGMTAKLPAAPRYVLPPLEAQPSGGGDKGQPLAIGKHRAVPGSALKKGKWEKLPGGMRIWRLAIHSPGAKGMRVHFAKFDAGKGKVWVYSGAEDAASYSGTGIDSTGTFWSDTVFADTVTVEYEPVKGGAAKGGPPFEISEITHLFR